jgi:hypothetical protein
MKVFFTLFFFLLLVNPAKAVTYWVAATGGTGSTICTSIDGTGDPGVYARSIATAVGCMVGGDTVIIKAGTYAERFDQDSGLISVPSGPSNSQHTIIKRNGADVVNITCPGSTSNGDHQCIHLSGRSNITFDGLTLHCNNVGGICFGTQGTTNITLQNSRVINGGCCGTSPVGNFGGGITNVNNRFIDNEINGIEGTQNNGVYISKCNDCLFERNWVHNFGRQGIQVHYETATSTVNNMVIRYNLIENNDARCLFLSTVLNLEFYGNICRNNGTVGKPLLGSNATIMVGGHSSSYNAKIYNNTIYANNITTGGTGCIAVSSGFTATVRNNACVDNLAGGVSANGIAAISTGVITSSHNLSTTTETVFVDASAGRFSPREGSLLIDQGTSTGLPAGFGCIGTCDQGAFEAPMFSSAVVEDVDPSKILVAYLLPSQSIRNNVGLIGGLPAHFNVVVASNPVAENTLTLVQTSRADVTLGSFVSTDQVVTIAYTRSSTNTFTDNVCIGGVYGLCKNAEIRTYSSQSVKNNVATVADDILSVVHFQCLDVYSTATNAITRGAQDADCTGRPGGHFAMAVLITGTGADPDPVSLKVYVNFNGGTFVPMTNAIDVNQPGFGSHLATGFMDGQAVAVAILSNPHAIFLQGAVIAQEQSSPSVDLVQNSATNVIITGRIDVSTVSGTRFCFQPRLTDGSVINYNVTPCLTVVSTARQ